MDLPPPAPQAATIIDPAPHVGTGSGVDSVLKSVPGVTLRRLGDVGSYTSVSIRGLGADNVGVVLDDVPLANTALGPIDLGLFPLASFARIEVYRGAAPVRFQSPLGGLIRLLSTPPSATLRLSAHAGYGTYNTRSAHIAAAGPVGCLQYSAFVGYQGSAGDFLYYNDRDTLYTAADDRIEPRANNASDGVLGRLTLTSQPNEAPGNGTWRLTSQNIWRGQGVPGPGAVLTHRSHSANTAFSVRAVLDDAQFFDEQLRASGGVDALWGERFFIDPEHEIGFGLGGSTTEVRQIGVDGRVEYTAALGHAVELAPRVSRETVRMTQGTHATGDALERSRWQAGVGAEYRTDIADAWRLIPSLRVDAVHDSADMADAWQTQWSPRGSVLWSTTAAEWRVSVGHYHRFPTLSERFGDGAVTSPNPNLHPEFGVSADVGVSGTQATLPWADKAAWALALFATRAQNLIVFVPNTPSTLVAENLGQSNILGGEASADLQLGRFDAHLAYTWLHARDDSGTLGVQGNQSPGISEHRVECNVAATLSPVVLRYEASFASQAYLDRANLRPLPPRLLHDVVIDILLPWPVTTLRLTAHNLTNLMHETVAVRGAVGGVGVSKVADVMGYPLPGRTFFLSWIWSNE